MNARARSRSSAKKAGSHFEQEVATWLARYLNVPVERRVKRGRNDMGDLAGLTTIRGASVVAEVKNVRTMSLGAWCDEAERERFNADAIYGVVIHKRYGRSNPGESFVTMTVDTFAHFINGGPIEDLPIVVNDEHHEEAVES